jgi:hypothetical protein
MEALYIFLIYVSTSSLSAFVLWVCDLEFKEERGYHSPQFRDERILVLIPVVNLLTPLALFSKDGRAGTKILAKRVSKVLYDYAIFLPVLLLLTLFLM